MKIDIAKFQGRGIWIAQAIIIALMVVAFPIAISLPGVLAVCVLSFWSGVTDKDGAVYLSLILTTISMGNYLNTSYNIDGFGATIVSILVAFVLALLGSTWADDK